MYFVVHFPIIKNFICKSLETDKVMCKEGMFVVTKLKEKIIDGSSIRGGIRDEFLNKYLV